MFAWQGQTQEMPQQTNSLLQSQQSNKAVNEDRKELIKAQTKLAEDNRQREQWKEYDSWGERFKEKSQSMGQNDQLLRNLARRVRALEEELNTPLDCSIVKEYI